MLDQGSCQANKVGFSLQDICLKDFGLAISDNAKCLEFSVVWHTKSVVYGSGHLGIYSNSEINMLVMVVSHSQV